MQTMNEAAALRLAVEVENRGAALYARASKLARDAGLRELFCRLRDEELQHAALFSAIAEGAEDRDYTGESGMLLSALAADIAFSGGLMRLAHDRALEDPAAVFDAAIDSEKNSIIYYQAIVDAGADDALKTRLREVIRQERGHMVELITRRAALQD